MHYLISFEGQVFVDGDSLAAKEEAHDDFEVQMDRVAETLAELTGGDFEVSASLAEGKMAIGVYVESDDLRVAIDRATSLVVDAFRKSVGTEVPWLHPVSAVQTDRELIGA